MTTSYSYTDSSPAESSRKQSSEEDIRLLLGVDDDLIKSALDSPMVPSKLPVVQMSPISVSSRECSPSQSTQTPFKQQLESLKAILSTPKSCKQKSVSARRSQGVENRDQHGHLCVTCGKRFDRRYNLKVHMRRHTGETPYLCPVECCPKQFKWRSSMAHHVRAHHGASPLQLLGTASRRKTNQQRNTHQSKPQAANRVDGSSRSHKNAHLEKCTGFTEPLTENLPELTLMDGIAEALSEDFDFLDTPTDDELFPDILILDSKPGDGISENSRALSFSPSFKGFEPDAVDLSGVIRETRLKSASSADAS